MSGDIEEFLRRAAARRARRKVREEIVIEDEPQVVQGEPVAESVAEHVAERIGTRKFDRSIASMTESRIEHADEDLEMRLAEKFEHRVGTLASGDAMVEEASQRVQETSVASDIAELLSKPQNVRQAIILSEILNPPQHRW